MIKNKPRVKRLISECVKTLNLDLSGMVVLTEAASGNYIVTPLIAALAGAEKVIALTRDSRYATASGVERETFELAASFGFDHDKIRIYRNLNPSLVKEADIVTNLGFLRPLDEKFLTKMNRSAIISLMYETWEYREQDLDLAESFRRGIPVLGVNENHESLRIFDYIGHLCLKILFEAEIEVNKSRIVLVGDNEFGKNIARTLSKTSAEVLYVTSFSKGIVKQLGATKIGETLAGRTVQDQIRNCDALIINTYPHNELIVGDNGQITAARLKDLVPSALIFQFNGLVDRKSLEKHGFRCLPESPPTLGHMGWTLAHLGPKPVVALNSGGLKVGELLARARQSGLDCYEAMTEALKNPICQDFSNEQYEKYRN